MADTYQQQIAELRARFAGSLGSTLADLRGLLIAVRRDPSDKSRIFDLHRHLHGLSGAAPMLGFPAIGDVARELDVLLDSVREEPALSIDALDTLAGGVDRLAVEVAKVPQSERIGSDGA